MAQKGAALHSGHRERLRKKVLEHGIDVLESHEVLELLLFYSIPRRNTNGIAHEMLDEFETLPGVLEAAKGPLEQISWVSEKTIFLLRYLDEFGSAGRPQPQTASDKTKHSGTLDRLFSAIALPTDQQFSSISLPGPILLLLGQQVIWEGKGVPFKEKQGDYRNLIRQALVKNAAYAFACAAPGPFGRRDPAPGSGIGAGPASYLEQPGRGADGLFDTGRSLFFLFGFVVSGWRPAARGLNPVRSTYHSKR